MVAWPGSKQKKKMARMALPAKSSRNLCEDTEEYQVATIAESNTPIGPNGVLKNNVTLIGLSASS